MSFALFSPSAITWLYNWELWDPRANGTFVGPEHVPMVRTPSTASQVSGYFAKCKPKTLLAFNEPDLPGSTYVSPKTAFDHWKQFIQHMKTSCGTELVVAGELIGSVNFLVTARFLPARLILFHYTGREIPCQTFKPMLLTFIQHFQIILSGLLNGSLLVLQVTKQSVSINKLYNGLMPKVTS